MSVVEPPANQPPNQLLDITTEVEWAQPLEELLAAEGEKCRGLAWLHNRAEKKYSSYNTRISLPVIILSTLAGTASVGQSSLFGSPSISGPVIGIVSITVGILNTIGSYFSWAKRSEGHKVANLTYSKLYRFICIEMSLPRSQRMRARDFLKTIRDQTDRLGEICPDIPPDIIALFNKEFKDYQNVKKPEITNGLEKISIYHSVSVDHTPTLVTAIPENPIKITLVDPKPSPKIGKSS
jgi:hypothetical protein